MAGQVWSLAPSLELGTSINWGLVPIYDCDSAAAPTTDNHAADHPLGCRRHPNAAAAINFHRFHTKHRSRASRLSRCAPLQSTRDDDFVVDKSVGVLASQHILHIFVSGD